MPVATERKVWTPRMDDAAAFAAYSEELGGERFAKFVIDTKTDAIYYFDVNLYKVHKDFIFQGLWHKERTKEANRIFDKNYGPVKPDFMMCYLVHHLAADIWTFAFWDGDLATAKQVEHAYARMKETFYLGDKVKFRPDSSYQETIAKEVKGVPVMSPLIEFVWPLPMPLAAALSTPLSTWNVWLSWLRGWKPWGRSRIFAGIAAPAKKLTPGGNSGATPWLRRASCHSAIDVSRLSTRRVSISSTVKKTTIANKPHTATASNA